MEKMSTNMQSASSTGGVGHYIVRELARKGAKVYVGARSQAKTEATIKAVLEESSEIKAEQLKSFVADVSNYKQVQKAAQALVAKEQRLDILVNNAAVLAQPLVKDEHGVSISMATNHFGPFLLTRELLPLLERTQREHTGVRVVNVSSTSIYDVPAGVVKFDTLASFNTTFESEDDPMSNYLRYGLSKVASTLHIFELQRRFREKGLDVLCISCHPGGIASDGAAKYNNKPREEIDIPGILTPFEGAITPLFAAAHPEPAADFAKFAGRFIMPFGGLKEPTDAAKDPELAKQLWMTSESILDKILG
jgi:NAD(P)-dependent dehydrogenase (short-subunit alcohol dehydrogenase family)